MLTKNIIKFWTNGPKLLQRNILTIVPTAIYPAFLDAWPGRELIKI